MSIALAVGKLCTIFSQFSFLCNSALYAGIWQGKWRPWERISYKSTTVTLGRRQPFYLRRSRPFSCSHIVFSNRCSWSISYWQHCSHLLFFTWVSRPTEILSQTIICFSNQIFVTHVFHVQASNFCKFHPKLRWKVPIKNYSSCSRKRKQIKIFEIPVVKILRFFSTLDSSKTNLSDFSPNKQAASSVSARRKPILQTIECSIRS